MQNPVFQLHQGLWRCASHFHIGAGEVEHIGRGVDGAEDAVGIEQAALKGGAEPVGQDDLEDVPLSDVYLGTLHHGAELRLVEQGRHFPQQLPARLLLLLPVPQQLRQLVQLQHCLVVAYFHVIQGHIDDEDDLLTGVVEGDDLIKEHQVHILKRLTVLHRTLDRWLAVGQVVVGEVAHQTAGEGGQVVKSGTFVVGQNLAEVVGGVVGVYLEIPRPQLAVDALHLQLGIKPQEGVPPPFLVGQSGLQQVAVGGDVL